MKATCVRNALRCGIVLSLFLLLQAIAPQGASAQGIEIKTRIPWAWIHDFEFYRDGIFIAPHNGGISYFTIQEDFNLTYRYTICPGGSHVLAQFCVADSYLFALDGAAMHQVGTPVFFVYSISELGYAFLAGLEPSGTIWAQFDPITYHKGYVTYHNYPADYYHIDVSYPADPFVTGTLLGATDVCLDIVPYQDSLLVATMQRGTGFWDGNFRLILADDAGGLSSVGTYGFNSCSYTAASAHIGSVLFTAHLDGLRVYDLSDLGNVHQIYFHSTYWGRCVQRVENYIYMGGNAGWNLFEYVSPEDIQHLEFLPNDRRVLRMRPRLEEEELWCFVDGGTLGGLVVLEVPGLQSVGDDKGQPEYGESTFSCEQIRLQSFPNPFVSQTVFRYSVPFEGRAVLGVYDSAGQLVRTLLNKSTARGSHGVVWDGADDLGNPVSTGIYFCRLQMGCFSKASKVIRLD